MGFEVELGIAECSAGMTGADSVTLPHEPWVDGTNSCGR
jgi:hypothetical protein